MARFNTARPARPRTPIRSEATASGLTFEGGAGFARDPKSEVFLGVVSDLSEDTFYEQAEERRSRLGPLIAQIAVSDPDWITRLVGWVRGKANLRSVAIFLAAEAVHARLAAGATGGNRQIVSAAIRRADEPAEFLAYWRNTYGGTLPKPVKRGVSDAVQRVYSEASWLKWRGKGDRGDLDFRDVLNLVHAVPRDERQAALFEQIVAHGYGRKAEFSPETLPVLSARNEFAALSEDERYARVTEPGAAKALFAAGVTWEALSGFLGRLDAKAWEAVIPNLGYTALRMNLRNFVEAGVSDSVLDAVSARLADADEVARSRALPVQFLAAYRNAPMQFHWPLEQALNHSVNRVPALPGRTLVLVDCSGSMNGRLSAKGSLSRMDAAVAFGAALALRAEDATLVAFGDRSTEITFRKSDSILGLSRRFENMGGTRSREAVARHYSGHDRVVNLTDEQYGSYSYWSMGNERSVYAGIVPEKVHTFTWNLAGYRYGSEAEGPTRHTFGGLTDIGFDLIALIEQGRITDWPF